MSSMLPTNPQFIYILLILPTIFAITLIGDGCSKCLNREWVGLINIVFGVVFLGGVVIAFLVFSSYFDHKT